MGIPRAEVFSRLPRRTIPPHHCPLLAVTSLATSRRAPFFSCSRRPWPLFYTYHYQCPAVKEVWSLLAPGGFSFFPSRRGRSARMSLFFFFFCSLPCCCGYYCASENTRARRRPVTTKGRGGDGRANGRRKQSGEMGEFPGGKTTRRRLRLRLRPRRRRGLTRSTTYVTA